MTRPLLPPRGVYVPARMIYDAQLPPALILTWIQLRGLAWGGMVTPPLRMQELAALTGKCQATIYGHMSQLRRMSTLNWCSTGQGTIIVTFAGKTGEEFKDEPMPPVIPDSQILESKILESNNPLSLSPYYESDNIQIQISKEKLEEMNIIQKNKDDQYNYRDEVLKGEEGTKFHESGIHSSILESLDPVSAYRLMAHLTPNFAQRTILVKKVTDLPLWQQTLEHWLGHGWNPRNITGMLQLYERNGAAGCRACSEPQIHARVMKTAYEASLEALEEVRRELSKSSGSEGA
jgi:hypothetical protein